MQSAQLDSGREWVWASLRQLRLDRSDRCGDWIAHEIVGPFKGTPGTKSC